MKAPIIVNEHGDIAVYESVEDAEMDLEAIDVENNEYVAYDSEGRLLRLIPKPLHEVVIVSAEQEPSHADELHAILFRFLMEVGVPADWLKQASLQELVAKALDFKIDLTGHPLNGISKFFKRWFSKA